MKFITRWLVSKLSPAQCAALEKPVMYARNVLLTMAACALFGWIGVLILGTGYFAYVLFMSRNSAVKAITSE